MDKIKIGILGGLDESFKSLTVVEINNDIFIIECGFKLPDRSKPGIDFIIPRYDYLVENKDRIRGYFFTHGYDSVIGALPYIYEKAPAPIFCTRTTADFLKGFCVHNHINFSKLVINILKQNDDVVINNRVISFFGLPSNFAETVGISISTDQGNIVYVSNFVVHSDSDKGFQLDRDKISQITKNKTLVLLIESMHADVPGYCSPKFKLLQVTRNDIFENARGRVFLAIDRPNQYNIIACLNKAISNGRKIIPYDESSVELLNILNDQGYVSINRDTLASIEDVNRMRPQEVLVFMTGFGAALFSKIALLANHNNDEKIVFVKKEDTFVLGNYISAELETVATESLDELYHTGCKIIRPNPKTYLKMHGCEEDIKAIISMFKPRYFVPNSAPFAKLLACAKLANNMNVGLNHNNILLLDNGNVIEFEAGIGKVLPNKLLTGDVFIDGKGVGDIGNDVIEERQRFADDGVIILGVTISKSKKTIVLGPDVQARGFVFLKENEGLIREITRLFVSTVETELVKERYSIAYMEEGVKSIVLKAVRRVLNKTPIIIPIIAEIE